MMHVVFWGTYDLGKPRTRLLLRGLDAVGVQVTQCHADPWRGVEDKSALGVLRLLMRFAARALTAYPMLVLRYLRLPRHDVVLVSYPGHLDVLVLWLFGRLRGVPVVWDAFMSVYNTMVEDRAMFRKRSLPAKLLFAWEWLACRAASALVLDTQAHGEYFVRAYGLPPERVHSVWVGVEPEFFPPEPLSEGKGPIRCLFYGQLIPLHGIETILEAVALSRNDPVEWLIIGSGQEQARVEAAAQEGANPRLRWVPWVSYDQLRKEISHSDVCLGIFGETIKAGLVIPNKAFQLLHAGRPLVTRRSPAIAELLDGDEEAVRLVEAGNPAALREAVLGLGGLREQFRGRLLHQQLRQRIIPEAIGKQWAKVLQQMVKN